MKKTLLVSAIALAVSGQAMAGQSAVDGLYGKIRLGLQSLSSDVANAPGEDSLNLVSGKLVFGFKGEEDLGNGTTMGYGIEFENDDADDERASNGLLTNDKSWISLGGSWGKVIAGEYGDFSFMGAANGVGAGQYGTTHSADAVLNTSAANMVQYRGSAGAVNFGIGIVQDGGKDTSSTLIGLGYIADNFGLGLQMHNQASAGGQGGTVADETGILIGAHYTISGITIGIANGDNGAAVDGGVTEVALSMGVGGGNLIVKQALFDADDLDETYIDFSKGLGNMGYWGLHFNAKDAGPTNTVSKVIAYTGINF